VSFDQNSLCSACH